MSWRWGGRAGWRAYYKRRDGRAVLCPRQAEAKSGASFRDQGGGGGARARARGWAGLGWAGQGSRESSSRPATALRASLAATRSQLQADRAYLPLGQAHGPLRWRCGRACPPASAQRARLLLLAAKAGEAATRPGLCPASAAPMWPKPPYRGRSDIARSRLLAGHLFLRKQHRHFLVLTMTTMAANGGHDLDRCCCPLPPSPTIVLHPQRLLFGARPAISVEQHHSV